MRPKDINIPKTTQQTHEHHNHYRNRANRQAGPNNLLPTLGARAPHPQTPKVPSMHKPMPLPLPFIISTPDNPGHPGCTSTSDGQVRRFIRSHVMKGKNKGKSYRGRHRVVGDSSGTATTTTAAAAAAITPKRRPPQKKTSNQTTHHEGIHTSKSKEDRTETTLFNTSLTKEQPYQQHTSCDQPAVEKQSSNATSSSSSSSTSSSPASQPSAYAQFAHQHERQHQDHHHHHPQQQQQQQQSSHKHHAFGSNIVLPVLSPKIGSDISGFQPADDTIETSLLLNVFKFTPLAKSAMFPLAPRIVFSPVTTSMWCSLLATDAAYLNSLVFAVHLYFDLARGVKPAHILLFYSSASAASALPPPAPSAPATATTTTTTTTPGYIKCLSKSLRLLRERLSDNNNNNNNTTTPTSAAATSDSTMMIIVSLATHSATLGQREATRTHLQGIRRIVTLRGGLGMLRHNPKLLMTLFRCDISEVLSHGASPLFYHDPVAEPFMPYLDQLGGFIPSAYYHDQPTTRTTTTTHDTIINNKNNNDDNPCATNHPLQASDLSLSDANLRRAWDTTSTFCTLLNYATHANRKIPQETLLNSMSSIMYRLLHLRFPPGSLDETARLALLAFGTTIFLQWTNVRLPYPHLARLFQESLAQMACGEVAPQLMLWVLVSGGMALFGEEDDGWLMPWIRTVAEGCEVRDWAQCRAVLRRFLWVDFVHDATGHRVFASAMRSQ